MQVAYNTMWNVVSVVWSKTIGVYPFSISVVVYLMASVIYAQLDKLNNYFELCKDPFTLNRLLDEYTGIIVQVHRSNKFVKFVLGSVNILAVPAVSISMSIITVTADYLVVKYLVGIALVSFLVLLTSTAAFMAAAHYKVIFITYAKTSEPLFNTQTRLGVRIHC